MGESEDLKQRLWQRIPPRSIPGTEGGQSQQMFKTAAAKWFVAAAVLWMSYDIVQRNSISASRRKPASLVDAYDTQGRAEGLLTNNITPVADLVPEKDERQKLLTDSTQLWEGPEGEADTAKRVGNVAKHSTFFQWLRDTVMKRRQ